MADQAIEKMDILLFRAGRFFWGVDVAYVVHVYWGISGENLVPLKSHFPLTCFGSRPEFGLSIEGESVPAIPLLSSTDSFNPAAFSGAAVVLYQKLTKMAVLAEEIVGTFSLDVNRQIHLLPNHLSGVMKTKGIWGIGQEEDKLIYLLEPTVACRESVAENPAG